MKSLVKYGELTETPDCDFPDGGRNLTERTIQRHLEFFWGIVNTEAG